MEVRIVVFMNVIMMVTDEIRQRSIHVAREGDFDWAIERIDSEVALFEYGHNPADTIWSGVHLHTCPSLGI